jgi:hypothetical protein
MVLDKAIKKAKGNEEEKIGISLKVSISLKEQLMAVASDNKVSVNALVSSILDEALNYEDSTNSNSDSNKELYKELDKHLNFMKNVYLSPEEGGIEINGFYIDKGYIPRNIQDIEDSISRISILKKILGE